MSKKLELYLGVIMDPIPAQCLYQGFIWQGSSDNLHRLTDLADSAVKLKVAGYLSESQFLEIQSMLAGEVQHLCLPRGESNENTVPNLSVS